MEKINGFNQMLSSALERVNELKEEVEERRTKTGNPKAFPLPYKELVACRRWLGVVWTTPYGQMDGVTTPKAEGSHAGDGWVWFGLHRMDSKVKWMV